MMKKSVISIVFLFHVILSFAQKHETVSLVKTDTTWSKEIFPFPIGFAPEIQYEGVEEARFPPGWAKRESPEFWSYVFVWKVKMDKAIEVKELEENIQVYFDGLMQVVNKDTSLNVPPTTALFLKKEEGLFIGKVRLYDAFHTKKVFTLHVLVEERICEQHKKSLIFFRFSPQVFEHQIWKQLKEVKLYTNACE